MLKMIYRLIKYNVELVLLLIIHWTPWYKAFIMSVWNKYKGSELYRLRWIEFSEEMAAELYTYKEHKLFAYYVRHDVKLMLKILFTPYSILDTTSIEDDIVRSHVVLK